MSDQENKERKELYKDREWLHDQYITRGKYQKEIAQACNCSSACINTWLGKFGIKKIDSMKDITDDHGNKLRRCTRCRVFKPLTKKYYHRSSISSLKGFDYVCKNCRSKYQIDNIDELLDNFIENHCNVGGYTVFKKEFTSELDMYLKNKNLKLVSPTMLTQLMKRRGFKTRQGHREVKYVGVGLKTSYDEIDLKSEKLNNSEICKTVSCQPGIRELEDFYNKQEFLLNVDLEEVKTVYRLIEKKFFHENIFKTSKVKITTALYITTNISQEKIGELVGITAVTIRNTLRLLKNDDEIMSHWRDTEYSPASNFNPSTTKNHGNRFHELVEECFQPETELVIVPPRKEEDLSTRSPVINKTYKNDKWLFQQYIINQRTVKEIGDECGVSKSRICRQLEKLGISYVDQKKYKYDCFGDKNGN